MRLVHVLTKLELHSALVPREASTQLVPNVSRRAATRKRKLGRDQPKQFGSLDDLKSAALATLKEVPGSQSSLVVPGSKSQHTSDTNTCYQQIGVYFFKNRKSEVTALLASCPVFQTTKTKTLLQRMEIPWRFHRL